MKPISLSGEKKAEIAAHLAKRPALASHVEKFQQDVSWHLVTMVSAAKKRALADDSRRSHLAMFNAANDLIGASWEGLWTYHWGVSKTILSDLEKIRREAHAEVQRLTPPKRKGRPREDWREKLLALVDDLYRNDRNREGAKSRSSRNDLVKMLTRFADAPLKDVRVRRGRKS